MVQITEMMELVLENIVNIAILVFEFIGVGIIIMTVVVAFIKFLKNAPDTAVYLARGFCMGLEFKMGSEILRTVVVRGWKEIAMVAGIIALRACLSLILHWEIHQEEKEEREKEKREREKREQEHRMLQQTGKGIN